MGGLQALAWAAAYPDKVERVIPVICSGEMDAWLIAWLGLWGAPIMADPAWKGGAYAADAPPLEGLKLAMRIIGLHARHWDWAEAQFGRAFAQPDASPADARAHKFKVETALEDMAATRAAIADANHLLYLVRANQTFRVGPTGTLADLEQIRAKTLMLYAPEDQVFRQERVLASVAAISRGGASVQTAEIAGSHGHFNGLLALAPLGPVIAAFLQS
jgi:homoserine O-acetyltransferase